MHVEQKRMIFFGQSNQVAGEKRSALQIESPLGFGLAKLHRSGFALSFGQVPEVNPLKREVSGRRDDLNRFAVLNREGCAKGLVAADDLIEAALQSIVIERAFQTNCRRDVISGVLRVHLMQKP